MMWRGSVTGCVHVIRSRVSVRGSNLFTSVFALASFHSFRIYSPVCGDNGKTYGNKCQAKCDGVEISCGGKCPECPR